LILERSRNPSHLGVLEKQILRACGAQDDKLAPFAK